MMKKEKKYYGIYFNQDIPNPDKMNKYHKKVIIKFEGSAYQIQRKKDGEIEKIEIQNEYELDKEGDYEIEFTNFAKETYLLRIRMEDSFLFLILLFLLGGLLLALLISPIQKQIPPLVHLFDDVDLAILPVEIKSPRQEQIQNEYDFDITLEDTSSKTVHLLDTATMEGLANDKIKPGDCGSFSIVIHGQKSKVDRQYAIKFEELNQEKPSHMIFKIRGENEIYESLQEAEKRLTGWIKAKSQKTVILDWEWKFETGENEKVIKENDKIDTIEGEKLNSYQFKILVTGKEVKN